MQTLQSLNREQGVTIIVVTHEADIAAYADRVITMRDGQIIIGRAKAAGTLRRKRCTRRLRARRSSQRRRPQAGQAPSGPSPR